jgi:hypothetical protein
MQLGIDESRVVRPAGPETADVHVAVVDQGGAWRVILDRQGLGGFFAYQHRA